MKDRLKKNHILAISIGLVYLWFGALKFFPGASPAESLAQETISVLSFYALPSYLSIILLAILEVTIGFMLLFNMKQKMVLWFAFSHILLTFTPMFIVPELAFKEVPFQFSLLGQYIFKNIIILSAIITLLRKK